jgi:hypothetical protein
VTGAAVTAAALAFSVSPVRVAVRAGGRGAITVRAPGTRGAAVTAAVAGYALDLHGRPLVGAPRGVWLRLPRTHVALRAGAAAVVPFVVAAPKGARPGDHPVALVLTLATGARGVTATVLRVVVAVAVRVPGRLRRGLAALGLAADPRRHRLRLVVANRGDVDEALGPRVLVVRLRRGRHVVATFRPLRRRLLARTRGVFEWRVPDGLRGRFTASVVLPHTRASRTFPLRL